MERRVITSADQYYIYGLKEKHKCLRYLKGDLAINKMGVNYQKLGSNLSTHGNKRRWLLTSLEALADRVAPYL